MARVQDITHLPSLIKTLEYLQSLPSAGYPKVPANPDYAPFGSADRIKVPVHTLGAYAHNPQSYSAPYHKTVTFERVCYQKWDETVFMWMPLGPPS